MLSALARAQSPASAYTRLAYRQSQGLRAPQQVSRALGTLIEHGLVHRVETMNAFVACAHPHGHEHGLVVFAICDLCSHVYEFSDSAIDRRPKGWFKDNSFRMSAASVELHGQCARCDGVKAAAAAASSEVPVVDAAPHEGHGAGHDGHAQDVGVQRQGGARRWPHGWRPSWVRVRS